MFQFKPISLNGQHPLSNTGNDLPFGKPIHANGTAVIIATRGRPSIVNSLVGQLNRQSKPPEQIFVIASTAADITGLNQQDNVTVRIGRTGSSPQRNYGLALAGQRFSYVVFFDDDFVPSRFWLERMHDLFESRPDVVGLTGIVLADGTTTAGIRLDDAQSMVWLRDTTSNRSGALHGRFGYGGNMGCNMAFRLSALRGIRFDEHLPLYAWLEDADFRARVERRGCVARADALWGVHLGHKQGRGRGITFGYSQIANAVYLAKKGTVPMPHLAKMVTKNLLSNTIRSLRPEPYVDRRGRLLGNMVALADLVRGRIAPERILEL